MRGCSDEILVFTNLIAHADATGLVDKHWRAISEETGISEERVKTAIANLEAPDPESRSPEAEGRRIVPIDEHRAWGWQIVNHGKYRSIRSEEDRREQNRISQAKWREKKKAERNDDVSKISRVSRDKPKQKQEADTEEEKREEAVAETAPPAPTKEEKMVFEGGRFDNPAVILFEEIFGFKTGSGFATSVSQKVKDLGVWKSLCDNKRAFADKPLVERKKIAHWILDEYDKRIAEKTNGTTSKSYQDQRADRAKRDHEFTSHLRQRVTDRNRKLLGSSLPDSNGQLQSVEPDADSGREGGAVRVLGAGIDGECS